MTMKGHVTPTGRSVLDELGLDAADVVKVKLALRIQKTVADHTHFCGLLHA